jgi:hypothetical protein
MARVISFVRTGMPREKRTATPDNDYMFGPSV